MSVKNEDAEEGTEVDERERRRDPARRRRRVVVARASSSADDSGLSAPAPAARRPGVLGRGYVEAAEAQTPRGEEPLVREFRAARLFDGHAAEEQIHADRVPEHVNADVKAITAFSNFFQRGSCFSFWWFRCFVVRRRAGEHYGCLARASRGAGSAGSGLGAIECSRRGAIGRRTSALAAA